LEFAVNRRMILLASLISTHLALSGADAMTAAYAEDAPQTSSGGGIEAQHQRGTDAGESSANTSVDTTTFSKSDSDTLSKVEVKARGKANSDDNATKGDVGGSKIGDHQTGPRGAAGGKEIDRKDATHSDSHNSTDHGGTEFTPIDTRFTIDGARRSSRWLKAHDSKTSKAARTSGNLRYGLNSTRGVVRNAIGLAVEVKKPAINDLPRSAKPLSNGETQAGRTDFHREGFVPAQIGVVRPHDAPISTAMNRSIVDGRDFVRAGSAASVGGRTKSSGSIISGTGFQIRHP
jgi:hypothetical protein